MSIESALDDLRSAMQEVKGNKWIDVNNSMTPEELRVLVYSDDDFVQIARRTALGWTIQWNREIITRVTHWMEMPVKIRPNGIPINWQI